MRHFPEMWGSIGLVVGNVRTRVSTKPCPPWLTTDTRPSIEYVNCTGPTYDMMPSISRFVVGFAAANMIQVQFPRIYIYIYIFSLVTANQSFCVLGTALSVSCIFRKPFSS